MGGEGGVKGEEECDEEEEEMGYGDGDLGEGSAGGETAKESRLWMDGWMVLLVPGMPNGLVLIWCLSSLHDHSKLFTDCDTSHIHPFTHCPTRSICFNQ